MIYAHITNPTADKETKPTSHQGVTLEPVNLSIAIADYPYVQRFRQITNDMAELYAKKNADYGNSFAKSIDEFGLVAGLVRLSDKWNRVCELIKSKDGPKVSNESLMDTAIDGACYFIMLAMEIERLSSGIKQANIDEASQNLQPGKIEFGEQGLNNPELWRLAGTSEPDLTDANPCFPLYDNNDSITQSPRITC